MKLLETLLREPLTELGDEALIAAMIEVEAVLAEVQGGLGVIPAAAGETLGRELRRLRLDPALLQAGMAAAGVPVPALIEGLRARLPNEAARWLHWGATSQDILDTALVLCLRNFLARLDARLHDLGNSLAARMAEERATPVMAHTRYQQAVPTVLGLRFASWLAPLIRYRQRLAELRPRLLLLQFGGAAGNLSALGDQGMGVAEALAKELALGLPPMPWHNQRDGLFELAAIAAGLAGSLGKMGQDILLAAQNEVGEMREASGGGSSTMPNKSNPVRSEALVSIARLAGSQLAGMQAALVHAQERDGSAWALEWSILPALLEGVLAASGHARELALTVVIDRPAMHTAITAGGGFALAEAASFVLARDMPRAAAQERVKAAVAAARANGTGLIEALQAGHDGPVDGDAILRLASELPAAQAMIDAVADAWQVFEETGR